MHSDTHIFKKMRLGKTPVVVHYNTFFLCVVVVVVLMFYVHDKHLRTCRDGQLT